MKDLESQPSEGLAEEAWKPTNLRRWSFAFQAPSNTIQTPFNHLLSTIQAPPAYLAWPRCTPSTHPPSSTFEAFASTIQAFTHTIQVPFKHPPKSSSTLSPTLKDLDNILGGYAQRGLNGPKPFRVSELPLEPNISEGFGFPKCFQKGRNTSS